MTRPLPFHAVAWTVAALLIAASPHLAAMPPWLAGLILLCLGWRLVAARFQWQPPPRWLRVALTLGGVFLVLLAFGGLWGRRTATTLLCVMLAAKMFELFRLRDLRMVASVCFFLIATQFLFNERLLYLLYLAVGALVTVIALIQAQRLDDSLLGDRSAGAPEYRSLLRQGAIMVAAALPVAVTLFVLFPRLAQPLWGLPDHVMDGRSGLSDSMSPGSIANLFLDDSPAFRVDFQGQPPPPEDRYWRGPVFWHFDGTTWNQSVTVVQQPGMPVQTGERPQRYRVQLEPHEQRWLFVLDHPVDVAADAHVALDYQVISRRPVTTLTQYDAVSNPDFVDMPKLHVSLRRQALILPPDRNPRTLEHARELRARYPDDRELIRAVLRWFNQEEFFYSLETQPTGRHGTDEFLFDLRLGYCEHYASAFAVLMRAAGIPARVVTGYQGGFWQRAGQYLLVRQSDAHAWNEVWLDGAGWVRVDPTAAVSPDRISQGSRAAVGDSRHVLDVEWLRNLRNRYDRVQYMWNRWILGFDARRQQQLFSRLGMPDVSPAQLGMMMVVVLAGVIGVLAAFLLGRRPAGATALERAWARLQRRLEKAGIRRRPGETPLEFLQRCARHHSVMGSELDCLAHHYRLARYGPDGHAHASAFLEQARRFRLRTKRELRRSPRI